MVIHYLKCGRRSRKSLCSRLIHSDIYPNRLADFTTCRRFVKKLNSRNRDMHPLLALIQPQAAHSDKKTRSSSIGRQRPLTVATDCRGRGTRTDTGTPLEAGLGVEGAASELVFDPVLVATLGDQVPDPVRSNVCGGVSCAQAIAPIAPGLRIQRPARDLVLDLVPPAGLHEQLPDPISTSACVRADTLGPILADSSIQRPLGQDVCDPHCGALQRIASWARG
mmetsp:Transcript_33269/g.95735  ORF Transcript_33269/g.95735 Transcript_33269/m.95735 type:complete len:223 (-) Transcript_33269:138-806(-)